MFNDDYEYEEEYEIRDDDYIDDDEDEDENALWDDEDSSDTEADDSPDKPKRKRRKKNSEDISDAGDSDGKSMPRNIPLRKMPVMKNRNERSSSGSCGQKRLPDWRMPPEPPEILKRWLLGGTSWMPTGSEGNAITN